MAEPSETIPTPPPDEPEAKARGTVDALSVFYVLGGIPAMILFFVALFLLVGTCDKAGIMIPA